MRLYIAKTYLINFFGIVFLLMIITMIQLEFDFSENTDEWIRELLRAASWSSMVSTVLTYYEFYRKDELPIFDNFRIQILFILIGLGSSLFIIALCAKLFLR